MRHFPSISEEEFHKGCQAFYETAVRGSIRNSSLQVANGSGGLSIKQEYLIGTPKGLNKEAIGNAPNENGELTDDEDHEVRMMMVPFVRA